MRQIRRKWQSRKGSQTLLQFFFLEGNVTTEDPNASEGVTHANDETDKDEVNHEKRKSTAKSVTLKDEVMTRSNSGMLCYVRENAWFLFSKRKSV